VTSKQKQAAAELELRKRERMTFVEYVNRAFPQYVWHEHNKRIADVLERIVRGEVKRAMFFVPPRHGKSDAISRSFPGYFLRKNLTKWVGLASYSATLAQSLSRDARDRYIESGREVRDDVSGTAEWMTQKNGGLWAQGVGGSITGKGFDLGIIDDPISNAEEALSQNQRNKVWEWWQSVFYTRQHPGAAIILIMTRWHEDDLAGRLLSQESKQPEHWHIVNFEAIKEQAPTIAIPETCTLEPDWRKTGEALSPAQYDVDALMRTKGQLGSMFWNALYRQSPVSLGGDIWKSEWFKVYDAGDSRLNIQDVGRHWDTAETSNEENAAVAFVEAGKDPYTGNIYVSDCGWNWLEVPDTLRWMKESKVHYIEAKSSGKSLAQFLRLHGIYAKEVSVHGDKVARARLASVPAENGKVFIERRIWDKIINDPNQGIVRFPNGKYKDLADAFSMALTRLGTRIVNLDGDRVKIAPNMISQVRGF